MHNLQRFPAASFLLELQKPAPRVILGNGFERGARISAAANSREKEGSEAERLLAQEGLAGTPIRSVNMHGLFLALPGRTELFIVLLATIVVFGGGLALLRFVVNWGRTPKK